MRFGLVHRVMTTTLAALGVLALVASGELGPWVNAAIVVGLIAALVVPETWATKPWLNKIASFGPIVLLAVQVARWLLNRPLLELAVEFAAALQIVRLATRRGAAHDQQVVVLALLHLIAGTVLGGNLGYGLCFLGFLVVAPGALVLSHLRREVEGNYRQGARDRTGLPVDVPRILRSRRVVGRSFLAIMSALALPIVLFTAVIFVVFPRVGLQLMLLNRGGGRLVGFSDKVDLGGVGVLRDDPTVAMRVEVPDLAAPPERISFYLRGTAFDVYESKAWSRSQTERRPAARDRRGVVVERSADPSRDRWLKIDLEPFEPPVLFLPPHATSLTARVRGDASPVGPAAPPVRIERGPEGELRYRAHDDRGVHYEVAYAPGPVALVNPMSDEDRARYLALPASLPPRIAELAHSWVKGAQTPLERARAIEEHLRTDLRYDLASPSGNAPQPLDHFLFESRRGHCEYFASSMAVMLRQVGVPSRNVTGFAGGTYNRFARNYTVRQGDAHAWVEAYIDGVGWQTFDPTPSGEARPRNELRGAVSLLRDLFEAASQRWNQHVVGYDLPHQLVLLSRLRDGLHGVGALDGPTNWRAWLAVVAVVAVGWGLFVYLQRRRRAVEGPRDASPERARSRSIHAVVAIYEQLDAAMNAQGLARAQGTPPLRHALGPSVATHALGPEILAITRRYIDVRFGGDSLDEDERRDLERRVRAVRAHRPDG